MSIYFVIFSCPSAVGETRTSVDTNARYFFSNSIAKRFRRLIVSGDLAQ